jgi:hypothetical protein
MGKRDRRCPLFEVIPVALYSVYARPGAVPVLVADRFAWLAALLPPAYAIVHGLWLALLGWVVGVVALAALAPWIGAGAAFWLYVLSAILIGFEAPALRRRKLGRRGWSWRGDMVAADEDLALRDLLAGR